MALFRAKFILTLALMLLPFVALETIKVPQSFGRYPDCVDSFSLCIAEHITVVAENSSTMSMRQTPNHFTHFECRHNCTVPVFDDLQLFERSDQLRQVMLNNSAVAEMSSGAFQNATNLSVLDLSYNLLERLKAAQFAGAVDLHSLRLSHNRLGHIDRRALSTCDRLAEAFFDHNQLMVFAVDLPTTLEALHLQGNRIGIVQAELPHVVRMLDVSNNELISFDASPLSLPSRLEYLNVARNRLFSLHNITHTQTLLRSLDASSNPIQIYHIFTFAPLLHLETLRLRRAGLQHRFGHGLFGDQSSLQTLDIGDNGLTNADWSVLDYLPALRQLSVSDNGLLDLGPLERWPRMQQLWLSGNRFNCTYLRRLVARLRDDQLPIDDDADVVADDEHILGTESDIVHGIACNDSAIVNGGDMNLDPTEIAIDSNSPDCKRLHVVLDEQWSAVRLYRIVAIVEGGLLLSLAVMVFWFVGISMWLQLSVRTKMEKLNDMVA